MLALFMNHFIEIKIIAYLNYHLLIIFLNIILYIYIYINFM